MSQEAKLTRAVRRRSLKEGEWLVTKDPTGGKAPRTYKCGSFAARTKVSAAPDDLAFQELALAVDTEIVAEEVLLISADDPATLDRMQWFFALVEERLSCIEEAEMLRLIDVAMPTLSDRPPPEAIEQARRNARARKEFLRQYEVLDADEVHALYGSRAKNKSALAARWRAEGKVFALEYAGRLVYPAFQFDAQGRPRPIIADVLATLGKGVGPWQVALWFTSPNGWLDDARPIDRLADAGDSVLRAAQDIVEPIVH